MVVLTPLVLQIIELGLEYTPELIAAARVEMALYESGAPPSDSDMARIDTALDAAHAALQAIPIG